MNHDIDASRSLLLAARHAAGAQQYPKGALYVVATPIGNLADLSLRAIHVLELVDAVACEDTRVAAVLMQHLGLHKPLVAVHEHNEREAALGVVERLQRGERIAFVSDAGTPAVSDPGARLVAVLREAGLRSVPIPGPSAVATALSVAGADADEGGFVFSGFLPPKGAARLERLEALTKNNATVVLYESPHRIATLAAELGKQMPTRKVTVARELSKQFEEVATMAAQALQAWFDDDANRRRGEFVIVVHASGRAAPTDSELLLTLHDPLLKALLKVLPLKQAVATAVEISGSARNPLYERALTLKGQSSAVD